MARVIWDKVGDRRFQTGVDRGVMYIPAGYPIPWDETTVIPWNGLTSVDEVAAETTAASYVDGVKYLDREILGDYSGKLKAITYPNMLDNFTGVGSIGFGLLAHDQPPLTFGLAYRTLVGNDLQGTDYGYRIHVIYNVVATVDPINYQSVGSDVDPVEFSWTLSAVPIRFGGFRPTAHLIFDSTEMDPELFKIIEDTLYGSDTVDPSLPSASTLLTMVKDWGRITITDNGDGTWTATGPSKYIKTLDPYSFEISNVDATPVDDYSFTITTTETV